MSISAITASFSAAPASDIKPLADIAKPTAPAAPAAPDPTVKRPADTVQLSEEAQIRLLISQGESPLTVANRLGIDESVVDSDLYISTAAAAPALVPSAAVTAAAAAPAAAQTTQFSATV